MKVKQELERILQAIQAEQVSYGELVFLQAHKREIKKYFPGEPLLWEYAGIPESEYNRG